MRCADTIEITSCENPKCRAIHIALLDEAGECFAQAVVGIADIPALTDKLRDFAYAIAAMTEGPR